jgi:hypothetical protein
MNYLSGLQTSLSRQHFFCSTSCHNISFRKLFPVTTKTHTHTAHHIPHPPNTIAMVVLFAATAAWLWQIIQPYPQEPLHK